jgi:hypothetical protein
VRIQATNGGPFCEVAFALGLMSPSLSWTLESVADAKPVGNWVLARWSHYDRRTPCLGFSNGKILRPPIASVNMRVGDRESGEWDRPSCIVGSFGNRQTVSMNQIFGHIGPTHRQFHAAADASVTPPIGQIQKEGDETLGRPLAAEQEKLILDADRSLQMVGARVLAAPTRRQQCCGTNYTVPKISQDGAAPDPQIYPRVGRRAIRPRRGGGC